MPRVNRGMLVWHMWSDHHESLGTILGHHWLTMNQPTIYHSLVMVGHHDDWSSSFRVNVDIHYFGSCISICLSTTWHCYVYCTCCFLTTSFGWLLDMSSKCSERRYITSCGVVKGNSPFALCGVPNGSREKAMPRFNGVFLPGTSMHHHLGVVQGWCIFIILWHIITV